VIKAVNRKIKISFIYRLLVFSI